jgi:hypothetical protein
MTIETDFLNTDFLLITLHSSSPLSILTLHKILFRKMTAQKDSTITSLSHKKGGGHAVYCSKCFALALEKIYHTRRQMRVEKLYMFRVSQGKLTKSIGIGTISQGGVKT